MADRTRRKRSDPMTPQALERTDPLEAAGIKLQDFTTDELVAMWEQSQGEQKLQAHFSALDQAGTITEEVLMAIVQGNVA